MPNKIPKAMNNTFLGEKGVFCFSDAILMVSNGSITSHNEIVDDVS